MLLLMLIYCCSLSSINLFQSVAWDKQRIIFGGKVLQDDRRLADCHVAGKTVHLVQRIPPPVSRGTLPQDEASRAGQSSQQSSQGEHDRVPL